MESLDQLAEKGWLSVDIDLESTFGKSRGHLVYGVRKPIAPGTTPIIACNPGSKEKIHNSEPAYWFESDKHPGLKIKLLHVIEVGNNYLKVAGYSSGEEFEIKLTKVSG